MKTELHEANRLSWNAATVAHNSHKGDQAAFFRQGGSTLFPEERALLGDINDCTLLHLQCNSGQDSLSLARLGARVTGVDISDEAIAFARRLSAESGIAADFERMDVYDYFDRARAAGTCFERVFMSYGTLCWLSDIDAWASGVADVLQPGGRFVIVDHHPVALAFDEQWRLHYDYFNAEPVAEDGVGDYVAESDEGLLHGQAAQPGMKDFRNPHPSFEFVWGMGRILTALVSAGLLLERFDEYPYLNGWKGFEGMRDLGGRRMAAPEGMARLPMLYGIAARKAEDRQAAR